MGEYVININWKGGKGSGDEEKKLKTYLHGTSLLPAAMLYRFNENSVKPDTLYGFSNIQDEDGEIVKQWEKIYQGVVLSQAKHFF